MPTIIGRLPVRGFPYLDHATMKEVMERERLLAIARPSDAQRRMLATLMARAVLPPEDQPRAPA